MPDQADADPVSVLLDWLRAHPEAQDLVGGPEHYSGIMEAPWPHVVLSDGPGGSLRDLTWSAEPEVNVEVYSAPNGAPGSAELRRILVRVLRICRNLSEEQLVDFFTPVVCRVRPTGGYQMQTLTNGQLRCSAGLLVAIHPPTRDQPVPPSPVLPIP